MSMATTVDQALTLTQVDYRILRHPHSATTAEAARRADVDPGLLAKAVVLQDHVGYLLAVLPASRRLDLQGLRQRLHRPSLEFVPEDDLDNVFFDCQRGAVPPLGPEYRVPTVVDLGLQAVEDVYFEAGDHEGLVHVDQTSFRKLMRGAEYLDIVGVPQ